MKYLKSGLIALLFYACLGLRAQESQIYLNVNELPDLIQCLPAPPQKDSPAFKYDIQRYKWGKEQRKDPVRVAQVKADAVWSFEALATQFSEAFGLSISADNTPEIWNLLVSSLQTTDPMRVIPKAHYQRIRPYIYFKESTLTGEDEELRYEGSYPSGHTLRSWTTALLLAEVNPARADEIFARAWIYGENRVIAGCHWQSDVDASRVASSICYSALQTSPAFRAQMQKAQKELRSKSACLYSNSIIEKPTIPSTSLSIADYGGVADGVTLNSEAFEKAVSALEKMGGGHLIVPEGLYLTGPIVLKDRMDLHLEKGAILLFTPDKKAFWDGKSVKSGISASHRHDVSITGEGIIDGNGGWWRAVKRSKVSDVEWKEFLKKGGTVEESLWYPFDLKNYENIGADARAQERLRTHLVRFTSCERVYVSGVTLQNSPKFHLVPRYCKDVVIEKVTVRCPWNAQNGDGIDIMQCQDVLITGCTVDVGDDGICLKAGAGETALQEGPCQNIVIEYNTVYHAHGGFVIGSEFSAGCKDILVRHNSFLGTDTGLRFKSAPERGGRTENIRISDIYMADIKDEAIVFQTDYADRPAGYDNNEAARSEHFVPDFQDIVMERVVCRGCATAVKAHGRDIHGILLKDSSFFWYDKATDLQQADMITLENVQFPTFE